MRETYLLHIIAGSLALATGYTALYAAKGSLLHRRSGMMFVYVMFAMTLTGFLMSALRDVAQGINVPAALTTAYLVATSLMTVRLPGARLRWLLPVLAAGALVLGVVTLSFGLEAIANGGTRRGMPAFPFFMFGLTCVLGALGDVRVLHRGPPAGSPRLVRHLWRMCFALFIAALSFFLGQSDEFPQALRIPALLAAPVLAVLVTMLYWVWRVGIRGSLRRMALGAPLTPPGRSPRAAPPSRASSAP